MTLRRLLARGILALWTASGDPAAQAHDYAELAPLDPVLRTALIEVLEEAAAEGRLRPAASEGEALEPGLAALLDALAPDRRRRLADRLREKAGVEDPARLPANLLLPLFYDLADFSGHAHAAPGDARAEGDRARLDRLMSRLGAR
jgi:hypothetical protein